MSSNGKSNWGKLRECVLSTEQVRSVDKRAIEQFGMNSLVLMENAALGCVQWLTKRFSDARQPPTSIVLCGSGNNGGDGFVIARHLRTLGWPCVVFAPGTLEKLSPDAAANARILLADDPSGILWWNDSELERLEEANANADVIIDAMLGTGAHGNPRPPFTGWIDLANRSKALRVAIDIPTGVDGDTGNVGEPHFSADATLTFVAKRPAMVEACAESRFGEIDVLPIGIPNALIEAILREVS